MTWPKILSEMWGITHSQNDSKSVDSRNLGIDSRNAQLLAKLYLKGELDLLELHDDLANLVVIELGNGSGLDFDQYKKYTAVGVKCDLLDKLVPSVFKGQNNELKMYLISLGTNVPTSLYDLQPPLVKSMLIRCWAQDIVNLEFLVQQFWYIWIRSNLFDGFICSVIIKNVERLTDQLKDALVIILAVMLIDMPTNGALILLASLLQSKRTNIMAVLMLPVLKSIEKCRQDILLTEMLKSIYKEIKEMTLCINVRLIQSNPNSARELLFELANGVTAQGIDTDLQNIALPQLKAAIWCARLDLYRNEDHLQDFKLFLVDCRENELLMITKFLMKLANENWMVDYILLKCFPVICTRKDVHCINEMFKLAKSKYLMANHYEMKLGLQTAYEIWNVDKRVSNEFMSGIFQLNQRLKSEFAHKEIDADEVVSFSALELEFSKIILNICNTDPFLCGKELLSILVPSMEKSNRRPKKLESIEPILARDYFEGYLFLCEMEVIKLQTAWDSVLKNHWDLKNELPNAVLVLFGKFFILVAKYINAIKEPATAELNFRELILSCTDCLIKHKESVVSRAGYEVLAYWSKGDDSLLIKYLTPEVIASKLELLNQFLVQKISNEIDAMPRPVFKGIAVEQGGKRQDSGKSTDSNEVGAIKMVDDLLQVYCQNSSTKPYLAPIALFSQLSKLDDITLICEQLPMGDGIEVLDMITGLKYFFESKLSTTNLDPSNVVEGRIDAFMKSISNDTSLKTINQTILLIVSLLLGANNLKIHIPPNLVAKVYEFYKSKIETISFDTVREYSSLCIVLLSTISLDVNTLEKALHYCSGNPNTFIKGYSCALMASSGLLLKYGVLEFVENCFNNDGWLSEGSAMGYAIHFEGFRQPGKPKPFETRINNNMLDTFKKYANGHAVETRILTNSLWVAAFCKEDNNEAVELVAKTLDRALIQNHESIIPLAQFAILKFQIEKFSKGDILKYFSEIKEQSIPLFVRLVSGTISLQSSRIPVTKKEVFHLMNMLGEMLSKTQSARECRSLAWSIGLLCKSMTTKIDSLGLSKSGEASDFARLSLESSYLRATFQILKEAVNADVEKADFILRNIIYKVDNVFPVVDWTFLIEFCSNTNQLPDFLNFTLNQCSTNSSKSILKSSLVVFHKLLSLDAPSVLKMNALGKLLQLGLHDQIFSPSDLRSVISETLKINNYQLHALKIIQSVMIKATISPQYEAVSIELLQSFSQFEGRVKDSNTAKWIQLVIESVINFSGLNDYIPTNKAIENVDECDLWVFNSIASIKAELMDDFILLFDKIAERKLHLSLLSYIAMLSATKMANSNTTPILRKWSMKFFNLTLARSKNNAYLASYYWKFILLTFIYFQNGKLDLSTVDYNLIRGGGFLMLTKGDFKGLKDLEQCIFKPN